MKQKYKSILKTQIPKPYETAICLEQNQEIDLNFHMQELWLWSPLPGFFTLIPRYQDGSSEGTASPRRKLVLKWIEISDTWKHTFTTEL